MKIYADETRAVREVNLIADAKCIIPLYILKGDTKNTFKYSNGLINYIALALSFDLLNVSLTEFVDSTHNRYEVISNVIENGIRQTKVKAYGKIYNFYNYQSKLIDSIKVAEDKKNTSVSGGYVYALINPSMEGLVKIGKTTKNPKDRAKELSSATGVATPFIVAYYRQFNDCDTAEKSIHRILEAKGVRYNSSREFFEIETHQAVEVISSLPDTNLKQEVTHNNGGENNNMDATLDKNKYFEIGKSYYDKGDFENALSYLNLASDRGHIYADRWIGEIYVKCNKPLNEQIAVFAKGGSKSDVICSSKIAEVYFFAGDKDSAFKYWRLYFSMLEESLKQSEDDTILALYTYTYIMFQQNITIDLIYRDLIKTAKSLFQTKICPIELDNEGFYDYIDSL